MRNQLQDNTLTAYWQQSQMTVVNGEVVRDVPQSAVGLDVAYNPHRPLQGKIKLSEAQQDMLYQYLEARGRI